MQIFVLDPRPEAAAQYHCDQHVKRLCVDYARLLAIKGEDKMGQWVHYSQENWEWMRELLFWMNMEYRWRFRVGNHAEAQRTLELHTTTDLPSLGFTVPPVCVPDRYFDADPIVAYRRYYYHRKRGMGTWTNRPVPWFMTHKLELEELAA